MSIRIVADCETRFFQFTTKFYAGNNIHIYCCFGYYFYTLLAFRVLFLPSTLCVGQASSLAGFGLALACATRQCACLHERAYKSYISCLLLNASSPPSKISHACFFVFKLSILPLSII